MAVETRLSHVYPMGSQLNERGRLEVGGCDLLELANDPSFGTPAYVYAEDDIRARARAYLQAFESRTSRFEVVYASKAFACVAAYELMAEEGLSVDVCTGGELFLALHADVPSDRIYFHGNNKSEDEIRYAFDESVGCIVVDSFDEIERLERLAPGQRVMFRITPGLRPDTHPFAQTGQEDSKFGFGIQELERALDHVKTLEVVGLHAHIGSQILDVEIFERLGQVLSSLNQFPLLNLGGGLGIAYTADDRPPDIDDYAERLLKHVPEDVTVLCEPGRSLVGNAGVTIYRVGTVKEIPGIRTYVAVDGGMSDNLRPMLYGSRYEAEIVDRFGGDALCTVAGMHCESGDILIRDVPLDNPRPGDVLVVPATGAYGHTMANNYNSIPRPPVVFCSDGDARVVVRRETYEDLAAREAR